MSKIEWTNKTWNPVTGCDKVSQGCKNCYAERMAKRLQAMGNPRYKNGFKVTLHPDILELPLQWKKPCMIFVNSMSDLFHEDVPDQFIVDVFLIMAKAKQHTFQILTKRPERMKLFFTDCMSMPPIFPLPNVWLGTSIESPEYKERADHLLHTPATIRFLSIEPILASFWNDPGTIKGMDWIICGGESGPKARTMNPEWPEELRLICKSFHIPFFFKQWGGVNKKKSGHLLDGKEYYEFPKSFPKSFP
jgi:protein gp37